MRKTLNQPKTIFITGASSGIGRALSLAYAAPGIRLFLCARNVERLKKTAQECEKQGAIVHTYIFDVINAQAVQEAINNAYRIAPIDLLIANAGISGGILGVPENTDSTKAIMETNIIGVINTVLPAITLFKKRQKGQIALMSSMAGYRGLMNCPAYSASKNCVKAWGEALRGSLYNDNIQVNVICPGFIRTPLTDANAFNMPFLMEADESAQIIKKGLAKNKAIISFPWIMGCLARIGTFLPYWLLELILKHLPQKEK